MHQNCINNKQNKTYIYIVPDLSVSPLKPALLLVICIYMYMFIFVHLWHILVEPTQTPYAVQNISIVDHLGFAPQ